jgi:hypothetical protein
MFLYDWQTLIAGFAALIAALIAVGGSEWRARKAVRAMLASEARSYVVLLMAARKMLKIWNFRSSTGHCDRAILEVGPSCTLLLSIRPQRQTRWGF